MINNSPAFPCEQGTDPNGNWNQTFEPGLTKREYFAALAMQGLLANPGLDVAHDVDDAAEVAVLFADKLLARLGGGQ